MKLSTQCYLLMIACLAAAAVTAARLSATNDLWLSIPFAVLGFTAGFLWVEARWLGRAEKKLAGSP